MLICRRLCITPYTIAALTHFAHRHLHASSSLVQTHDAFMDGNNPLQSHPLWACIYATSLTSKPSMLRLAHTPAIGI
eukprot:c5451_g1_i1 orf=174-404(+)